MGRHCVEQKGFHRVAPLFGLMLFIVAMWVLHHELRHYRLGQIVALAKEISASDFCLALGLAVLSYLTLTGYDVLALHYIRHDLPYPKIGLASFVGYAFSNNVGHGTISGGTVRLHLYTSWGLSAVQIAKIMLFNMATLWLGLFMVAGTALLAAPIELPAGMRVPTGSTRLLGGLLIFTALSYLFVNLTRTRAMAIRGWRLPIPGPDMAVMQLIVSAADWCLAAGVLYALLPGADGLTYLKFLRLFLVGQLVGMVSQVPGGLGIFETVIVVLLRPYLEASHVLASLLAFRVVYYILPLALAMVLFCTYEATRHRENVKRVARIVAPWAPRLVPHALALTAFAAGAVLLFSGATPALYERMHWLRTILPRPIIELSHFLASLVGVALLILARGIQRRVHFAYVLTAGLLVLGIAFSLLKDFDYEEAIVLTLMLAALLLCRREFYREASVLDQPFTPSWVAAIAAVMIASLWLAFFSHKHVEISTESWWQFAFTRGTPLGLRASVCVSTLLLVFGISRLLHPHQPEPVRPTREQIDKAQKIIETTDSTFGYHAMMGDKSLLFSESGNAFIMYGIESRSWVALGDPVGDERDMSELVWRFREMVDRHDGLTIFHQVTKHHLDLYLDLGLTLLKLGEEALVPLHDFSLDGHDRKGLRQVWRHVLREGGSFQVIPRDQVPQYIPEFQQLFDAWLAEKNTREKGFSIARFDPVYLGYFPAAVVRKDGQIVAFANVMGTGTRKELSLELMRYNPNAPHGVMDFLFIELMLWGQQEGYEQFNLGMAPLAGLHRRALAPAWNRFGSIIFRLGEHFFNFQGLRQYKDKFNPTWQPKFIASPGGLALPRILANIAALISRGVVGVVAK